MLGSSPIVHTCVGCTTSLSPYKFLTTKVISDIFCLQICLRLEGSRLKARAAIGVEDSKDSLFGAIWFDTHLNANREESTITAEDVTVTKVRVTEQNKAEAISVAQPRDIDAAFYRFCPYKFWH